MKKTLSLILACMMIFGLTAALAGSASLKPIHAMSMENFGTGDCTVMARFDGKTAFDDKQQMTFTVIQDDLYPTADVKALKAGDTIELYGEDVTIQTIAETETGYAINQTEEDAGYELYYSDPEKKDMLYVSDCDIPNRSEMGSYTFPLADPVEVRIWNLDENGNPKQELDTVSMPAADVKAYFASRSDEEKEDYLNTQGEHVLIRVQDGKVTEIEVNWGSDD